MFTIIAPRFAENTILWMQSETKIELDAKNNVRVLRLNIILKRHTFSSKSPQERCYTLVGGE